MMLMAYLKPNFKPSTLTILTFSMYLLSILRYRPLQQFLLLFKVADNVIFSALLVYTSHIILGL